MAQFNDDIFFASITELNSKLRAKEFSAVELTRAFCDRLEKLGPKYNALALSLRERAIRQAKDVDDDLKRERFRRPLQGIPFGAKDLLSVAGQVTTWGARPFAGQVFDYDATVLKKIAATGGILTGKLSMVELAGGGGYRYASASLQGAGINPWDRSRWSGGSSSGSGSAVAAGLVTYALGSETWGSIVTPSAFCGLTGLRPTYGLVSRYGAMALSWTMDKIGPLCRSAEDCGIVLGVIAGGDSNDAASANKSFYYAPQYARLVKDIRVGFAPVDFAEWADPETRPDYQKALETLRSLGLQMSETKLPELPYPLVAGTVITAEGSSIFEPLIRDGRIDQLADRKQVAGLKAGLQVPAHDYLKAMRLRTQIQHKLREMFGSLDVLISPSRFSPATKLSQPLDKPPVERPEPKEQGLRHLNAASNLAGLPCLSLPCGFGGGLPIGLSLVSRPFSENLLLTIGREFQKQTDWHKRRPPVGA